MQVASPVLARRARAGRVLSCGCGFALATLSFATGTQLSAAEVLAKSMQPRFAMNVVAILLQRDPKNEGCYQSVKVERDTAGRSRCTVLEPLRLLGVTTVDDGDRIKWYLPDSKLVIDQDSPAKEPCEVDQRIRLAKRNYTFRLESSAPIAGRQAVCVVANPRHEDLETRRYFLDKWNSYPLKLETCDGSGDSSILFDTKYIEYPKSLDPQLFQLEAMANVRTLRYERPTKITNFVTAAKLVGFAPLVPEGFPLGFQVQEVQYNDSKDWKSVVVRLTDGLARATVYQWKMTGSGASVKTLEDSTVMDYRDGVRLMLVSDLSAKVRARLLETFISQASANPAEAQPRALLGLVVFGTGSIEQTMELLSAVRTFAEIENLDGHG